jgi:hypothetical protein
MVSVLGLAVAAVLLVEPPPVPPPSPGVTLPPSASPQLAITHVQRPAGAIFEHRHDEGLVLRRVGLGVTIFGTVLAAGGLMAAFSNPCGHDGARGSNCEVDVRNAVALTMGVTALGALTAGITSMAVGHSIRKRQLASGLALNFNRGGGGLLFVVRF